MDIGVFIPINNNGWIISATSPQYMPSFELNKAVVQKAEGYGFDFALSMIKLHGFGGKTEFWNHGLESFTLMAALAPVTSRIKLFASTAVLTLPPAMVARMTSTIDDVSGGRFGVNIVSGWHKIEYTQMGLWPGDGDKRLQGPILPDGQLRAEPATQAADQGGRRRAVRPRHGVLGAVLRL